MREVIGSSPIISTTSKESRTVWFGFFLACGGDIRDISPVGHAAHAATLHARADERIYETRAFRVRSLKGESRYLHQEHCRPLSLI